MMGLRYQMESRKELEEEARRQYLKEKAVVDNEIEKLKEQEMSKMVVEQQKKKKVYEGMLEEFKLKEEFRMQEAVSEQQQL